MVKENQTKNPRGTHEEWIELCEYVKLNILGYSEDMKYPRNLALRLQGLTEGKFISNKKAKPMAFYRYKTILLTFKANQFVIKNAMARKEFNGESNRINYMFRIIEDKINEMVLTLERLKKEEVKAQTVVIEKREKAEYQKKTKEVKSNILNNLW